MAAEDTTRLIIQVETLLKGLDKTLRGLAQVETQLKRVANIKVGGANAAAGLDKAALAAQRLQNQQQKLSIQSQNLATAQLRADLAAQRLVVSQQRLAVAQQRVTRSTGQQADAHVRAFRAIQRGVDSADAHVRFFRATEESLRKAPQLDAHVRAFRAIEEATSKSRQEVIALGNSLRSIGQGLASLGAVLTTTLTVPLTALGAASVAAATRVDSLRRGLTAIVGSSAEAGKQLARLTELAKLPGIGFEEAIQGSIRLQAVGFSAREAERNLREFANAVALTGGGREELARITVQLGQLAAKGKVLSQDLRPIIEAAPAVGRALKEAFGTVNADDLAQLTGSSKEFLDILVTELEKLPRAAAGARNSFENFRDTVFRAAAAVGEALVPALVQLAEIAGPIITTIAEGFNKLPVPIQSAVVAIAALLAAAGPLAFVIGVLVLGVGRLVVGIAQFNAQVPASVAGLFGLATGANAATGAMTALRAATIAVGSAFVGLAAQLAIGIAAYALYNRITADTRDITDEQITATREQTDVLKDQLTFINGLSSQVTRTADEQQRLMEIYRGLNIEAQQRVGGIKDETVSTAKLTAEVERLLQVSLRRREQEIAQIVGNLADTQQLIKAREAESDAIAEQIDKNTQLIAVQRANTDANDNSILRVLELSGANETLVKAQNALAEENEASRKTAEKYAAQLRALGVTSVDQIRQFLLLRQAMGLFHGDVEAAVRILDSYINVTKAATAATDEFQKALTQQSKELLAAGTAADELQKKRRALISAAGDTAREAAKDFQGALKFMQAFIAAQPELKAAIEREAQVQGKSIAEVIDQALGATGGRRESALRNAQVALVRQLEDVAKAAADKQLAIEEQKNEQILNENETAFKRQLRSYQQYLQVRAELTVDNLNREARAQAEAAKAARETGLDLLRRAAQPGISEAERTRRRTQAAEAEERAIKAETKLAELETKRDGILAALQQTQAETSLQQIRDIRQLEIEYANLQGRIESAFRAETLERFGEQLQELSREQAFLGEQLKRLDLTTEEKEVIKLKREQNQRQIELIRNLVRTNDALATLRGSEQAITDAKQRQAELEQRLDFLVRFRGLAEEEAIRQRLEGEALVQQAIDRQRTKLEALAAEMKAAGLAIPKALADAISELKVEALGLGELDFVEQFRLAQKEFDKLNDERIRKIQEVERAVAHRDISELQGRIAIRAANGEYIGALEQQLEILQKIAAASGDIGLQRQAADAATTAAEVRNATTEVADLNTEIRSLSVDALRDSFGSFLDSLRRGADAAKEALNNMVDSVLSRVNEAIANRIFDKFLGPLLGGIEVGVNAGVGGIGAAGAGVAGGGLQASAAAAGAALTTGGTTAGTAMTTGGTAASAALTASGTAVAAAITSSAAALAAAIAAAGAGFVATTSAATAGLTGVATAFNVAVTQFTAAVAAFVAAVGAQATTSTVSSLGGLGSAAADAATGLFPAVPGGLVHIVEGGHDEAVLTTDPKYAVRQMAILREYLARTRGLWGRIPNFAAGGMISASQVEAGLLQSLSSVRGFSAPSPSADMQLAAPSVSLRNINLIDRGAMVGGYLRSAEGTRDILNTISTERDEVGRRIGVRR